MPAYRLNVSGPEGVEDEVVLQLDDNLSAVNTAFSSCSTFGHSLWRGSRFLGHFEPGECRLRDSFFRPNAPGRM
ncbi:MAG: hypothetical protein ABW042_05640, partial [Phenylobacterium sp.]